MVAHELGHVWIYTHHPYLQTEQLANQIAMRVVSRESLDSVYGKVWADAGGPLPRFYRRAWRKPRRRRIAELASISS